MYDERVIDGIKISRPANRFGRYIIENTLTGAHFTINKGVMNSEGEPMVFYMDSFDNLMSNNKQLKIIIKGDEVMQFKEYRSRANFSNDLSITTLPMKEIQEVANKTFYADGQLPIIDFLTYAMT